MGADYRIPAAFAIEGRTYLVKTNFVKIVFFFSLGVFRLHLICLFFFMLLLFFPDLLLEKVWPFISPKLFLPCT